MATAGPQDSRSSPRRSVVAASAPLRSQRRARAGVGTVPRHGHRGGQLRGPDCSRTGSELAIPAAAHPALHRSAGRLWSRRACGGASASRPGRCRLGERPAVTRHGPWQPGPAARRPGVCGSADHRPSGCGSADHRPSGCRFAGRRTAIGSGVERPPIRPAAQRPPGRVRPRRLAGRQPGDRRHATRACSRQSSDRPSGNRRPRQRAPSRRLGPQGRPGERDREAGGSRSGPIRRSALAIRTGRVADRRVPGRSRRRFGVAGSRRSYEFGSQPYVVPRSRRTDAGG